MNMENATDFSMCFGIEQYEVLNVNHIKGVHPENRVIGFVLLAIRPPELGKTTNTTFTTSNNLHASRNYSAITPL